MGSHCSVNVWIYRTGSAARLWFMRMDKSLSFSIDWVLIVVPVEWQRPPYRSIPRTVDCAVLTSDANDGGAGVRALKAFFKMKGFTSVAKAARISLSILAGTTRR
ncbi:hypothetical protein U1Q18_032533 [Sarracenia purpurea var. burkii]